MEPAPTLVYGVGARALAVRTTLLMLGCVMVSYGLWVWEGVAESQEKWLPTISNTWERPPASYVSRLAIGHGAAMLCVLNGVLYFAAKRKCQRVHAGRAAARGPGLVAPELLLSLAGVGTFCLSWVAAICDDAELASCLGNNTVHTAFAMTFFVTYDLRMVLGSLSRGGSLTASAAGTVPSPWVRWHHGARWWSLGLAVGSTAATGAMLLLMGARWRAEATSGDAGIAEAWDDVLVASIERLNVWFVALWTATEAFLACPRDTFGFGTLRLAPEKDAGGPRRRGEALLWGLPTQRLANLVAGLYLGVLSLTALVGLAQGHLPPVKGELWFISDMWTLPPSNWLSRWATVQGAHWGAWVQLGVYGAGGGLGGLRCSLVALCGLSIVGACNENENWHLHVLGAILFFGGYDAYMVRALRDDLPGEHRMPWRIWLPVAAMGCQLGMLSASGHTGYLRGIEAACEWVNAIAIIAFFWLDVRVQVGGQSVVTGFYVTADVADADGYELLRGEPASQ